METLWFCLVAFLLTGYVVLDGFDLGAGVVSLFAARGGDERGQVVESIGPFWDGNEVWLLAGGGTLFFAFPALYASSFSGFYLPLMIVLWLLILRGISIEFRHHVQGELWQPLWDRVFGIASALLAVFYGAALGNVVRGVPLNADGDFFLPLWTDWGVSGAVGILDWFTALAGLTALATLTMHGALWVAMKTRNNLERNAGRCAGVAALAAALLATLLSWAAFSIQPLILRSYTARPWGWIFPAITVAALAAIFLNLRLRRYSVGFLASGCFIAGMIASVAFGLFPYVLPATEGATTGLTVWNSAAPGYGLRIGLAWWIPGMALACVYFFFLYRRFRGKIDGEHLATSGG